MKSSENGTAQAWIRVHDVEKLIRSRNPKHLPLFVQNVTPRPAEFDVVMLPRISIFDKQADEWCEILLVCGEGKSFEQGKGKRRRASWKI